jgi:thioredoxin-like negative regulator of GroEL
MRGLSPAVMQATAEHKMIIVDLVADWCGWCRTMETQTWSDPAVVAESARFVFLQLDIEKDLDGIALARRFRVSNLPTTLLLTSVGEEFDRVAGFLPAREFLARLNATLANPRAVGNLRILADREPGNIEARYQLAEKLLTQPNYGDAEKQFSLIVQKDPRNRSGRTDGSLYYLSLCQADRSDMTAAVNSLERLRKDFPASPAAPGSYLLEGQIMLRRGKRAEARALVLEFIKKYPGHALREGAQGLLAQIDNGR